MSPVVSASGMNESGGQEAAAGMVPADQRLGPDDRRPGDVRDRLEVDHELVLVDRMTELGDQLEPVARVDVATPSE